MSDTPRTDRCEINTTTAHVIPGLVVDADVCRELERENAALREDIKRWKRNYYQVADSVCRESSSTEDLCKQARGLWAENAALREELKAARKLLDTHLLRSDLFSYLAWLEEHRDRDMDLKGAEYLVLSSDGTTCWGKTFMEAVQVAEQHDRALFDAARKEAKP